jgi:hypothetical protein
MDDGTMPPEEVRAALDAARLARRRMAGFADCPPWRHAAFGAVMALLVLGAALPPLWEMAAVAVALAAAVLLVRSDRARYGVFINGYRKGATRPLTFVLLAALLGLTALQYAFRYHGGPGWAKGAVVVAAFALATFASVQWSRVFRREMERDG